MNKYTKSIALRFSGEYLRLLEKKAALENKTLYELLKDNCIMLVADGLSRADLQRKMSFTEKQSLYFYEDLYESINNEINKLNKYKNNVNKIILKLKNCFKDIEGSFE